MKKIEQYLHNHRPAFDNDEPAPGHYARFQHKAARRRRRRRTMRIAQIAAAAVIAAVLILNLRPVALSAGAVAMINCENAPDFRGCYLTKMNRIAAQIDTLTAGFDDGDRREVLNEVYDLLEAGRDIEDHIPSELPDDEAQHILQQYYQHSLTSLQAIAEHIRRIDDTY
jgi:hypothetical protein